MRRILATAILVLAAAAAAAALPHDEAANPKADLDAALATSHASCRTRGA